MKLRVAVGAALLAIGIALAALGIAQRGMPWGFRGHAAALAEATHNVELVPSLARAGRDGLDDAMLPKARGTFLDVGDSVRVGIHSEARLLLPGGALVIGDGTRVVLTAKGARLEQGAVDVVVTAGAAPFVLELAAPKAEMTLRAATGDGGFRIISDGKHEARVAVRAGSVDAASGADAQTVTAGKVLRLGADKALSVEEPATSLALTASCAERRVTIQAPAATQLFVDGVLYYPEGGQVRAATVPEHPERTHVFGRDVVGNVAPVAEIACVVAPPIDQLMPNGAPAPPAPRSPTTRSPAPRLPAPKPP